MLSGEETSLRSAESCGLNGDGEHGSPWLEGSLQSPPVVNSKMQAQ